MSYKTNTRYLLPYSSFRNRNIFFDFLPLLIVAASFALCSIGFKAMMQPMEVLKVESISLDPRNLLEYSLRSVLRMFIAIIFSFIFTLIYANLAARSSRLEKVLIPLLDVLQSVPIFGYISFTVTMFLAMFPDKVMGAEAISIFAIFASQVWNMIFSLYQSLKTIPTELIEVADIFKMSSWQRFWRIELPFAMPALVWNIVISVSGSWFFLIASEAITVGSNSIALPGIGSYIAMAIPKQDIMSIIYAILAMSITIILYDQILIKPLVVWSNKFHYEMNSRGEVPKSWMFNLLRNSKIIQMLFVPIRFIADFALNFSWFNRFYHHIPVAKSSKIQDLLWGCLLGFVFLTTCYYLYFFCAHYLSLVEIIEVGKLGLITLLRVICVLVISMIIWVPIGIYIGLSPKLASILQPIVQFLASFPANLLFPIVVIVISHYNLDPNIWLTCLMVIGSQWYILFNIIAGSAAFPSELQETVKIFQIKNYTWVFKVILPTIAPYLVTGCITAAGGAWNASVVAEIVTWGDKKLIAKGLGSYIAEATRVGDFPHVALGIIVMSGFVVIINTIFWRPLHNFISKKYQL